MSTGGVNTSEYECLACMSRSDRLPCDEHLPGAMREIEARGYARGIKDRALAISEQGAWADAIGYARGVEDAAKLLESGLGKYDWLAVGVRALLKPKGEAK